LYSNDAISHFQVFKSLQPRNHGISLEASNKASHVDMVFFFYSVRKIFG